MKKVTKIDQEEKQIKLRIVIEKVGGRDREREVGRQRQRNREQGRGKGRGTKTLMMEMT